MSRVKVIVTVAYVMVLAAMFAGCSSTQQTAHSEHILDVLARADLSRVEDGCGDSPLYEREDVKGLVAEYEERLIPVLIANLSNPLPTRSMLNRKVRISLGCVCLDVLEGIIEQDVAWYPDPECGDDGWGSCMRQDLLVPVQITRANMRHAHDAQREWQALYDTGHARFDRQCLRRWESVAPGAADCSSYSDDTSFLEGVRTENPNTPYVTLADAMKLPEPADMNDVLRVLGPPGMGIDMPVFGYSGLPDGVYLVTFWPTKEIGLPRGTDPNTMGTMDTLIPLAIIYATPRENVFGGEGTYVYPARLRGRRFTGWASIDCNE